MDLKKVFEKQGGMKLIKQYWKSGVLLTAISQFLFLGRSRTALEILRLATTLKIKEKMYRKYKYKLDEFERDYVEKEHKISNKIWICWFQGMDNAPSVVKKCYQSVIKNNQNKEVVLITSDNMMEYVQFPDFIIDKWKKGQITYTHMTDLLRLELLIRYGGMWLDATVFCSTPDIPSYFFDSELFLYQCLKPGRDGNANYISSWLISAKSNNKILMATKELCYEYWKKSDFMWDYFLLHDFFSIVLDKYENDWKKIIPSDNATPHILLLRLFDQYDEVVWNAIKEQTPFHKLTYKFSEEDAQIEGTNYRKLLEYNG